MLYYHFLFKLIIYYVEIQIFYVTILTYPIIPYTVEERGLIFNIYKNKSFLDKILNFCEKDTHKVYLKPKSSRWQICRHRT